jgi:hypothetical protein
VDRADHRDGRVTVAARDAVVAELHGACVPADQHVAGLDVAVLHRRFERVPTRQRAGDSGADPRHLGGREAPGRLDQLGEVERVEVLQLEPDVVLVVEVVGDADDAVDVAEARRDPGLAQRAGADPLGGLTAGYDERDLLERDLPVEPLVRGRPDHAHTARADDALEAVATVDQRT